MINPLRNILRTSKYNGSYLVIQQINHYIPDAEIGIVDLAGRFRFPRSMILSFSFTL